MPNNKITVAIVDDNEEFCSILDEYLSKQEDIEVVGIANDGLEALKLLEMETPNVLILDIIMPHLDGLGVLEEINHKEEKPYTIMLSAVGQDKVTQKAIQLGADYYIIKPFDFEFFLKRIRESKEELPLVQNPNQTTDLTKEEIKNIEKLSAEMIYSLGVPAHIKGYAYLKEAIVMVAKTPEYLNAVTKELYPGLARQFDTTPSRVERAIRHSIEVTWNQGESDEIKKMFEHLPKFKQGNKKPTNSEFIAVLADKIRLKR